MVKIINSWAQGIIITVIIVSILEIILPEGKNKKYVKVIFGIYILFTIIHPIVNGISKNNLNFAKILNSFNLKMEKIEENCISIETNSYIESTYKNTLKKDIENKLMDKGYICNDIKLYLETEDEEKFGVINNIILNIEKNSKESYKNSNYIEEVNVNLSSFNNNMDRDLISGEEINCLKEYLENFYSIEKEKIHINE